MTPAELAEAHVGMVYGAANRHRRACGGDIDDLIGEGMVALMKAAVSFDAARGVPFPAFAKRWISGAMLESFQYDARHHPVDRHAEVPEAAASAAGPEQVAVDRFALARLLERVAMLPVNQREVISVVIDGGRFRPIYERDGVTLAAVSQRLRHARATLRRVA